MGGNMDSMVNHYTVSKAHRKADAYTPGGVMGKRPDYAVTVYCNLIRRTYRRKPIIIGGIEASLRRLAHYDYWSDKLKRSILLDSQADLLIYGMGERAVVEIANALNDGMDAQDITYIDGTVYKTREPDDIRPVHHAARPSRICRKTRASTPRAFPSSTATPTPSAPSGSSSRMATMNLSSRTRRRSRFRRRKWIMSTICPYCRTYPPIVQKAWRHSGHRGGRIQPDLLPGLLRRVQLLRADVPSGADHPDPHRRSRSSRKPRA